MIKKSTLSTIITSTLFSLCVFTPTNTFASNTETPSQESLTKQSNSVLSELAGYGSWWKKDSCIIHPVQNSKTWWTGRTCEENLNKIDCLYNTQITSQSTQPQSFSQSTNTNNSSSPTCEEQKAYKQLNRWSLYTAVDFNEKHELYRLLMPYDRIHKDYEGKVVPEVLNCPWIAHTLRTEDFSNIVFGIDLNERKFMFKNVSDGSYGEILTGLTIYKVDVKNRGAFLMDDAIALKRVFTINKGGAVYELNDGKSFSVEEDGFVKIYSN